MVENLVTLGVMPVGVADTKGYTNWVSAAKLDAGGQGRRHPRRGQRRRDRRARPRPGHHHHRRAAGHRSPSSRSTCRCWSSAAPTRPTRSARCGQPRADRQGRRQDRPGQDALADFDKKLAEGKQKIAAAGKAGSRLHDGRRLQAGQHDLDPDVHRRLAARRRRHRARPEERLDRRRRQGLRPGPDRRRGPDQARDGEFLYIASRPTAATCSAASWPGTRSGRACRS